MDDMDGKLHCDKCGKETKRYVAEGKEDNIAKLRKDYKDAKGWVEMAKSDVERRKHQATVQKIWNHAKNQYKIDLDRKDGKLDEGIKSKLAAATLALAAGGANAYMPTAAVTSNSKALAPVSQAERDKNNWDAPWTVLKKKKDLDKATAEVEKEQKKSYHKVPASEGFSPFKPNARVKIISGPKDVVGKEGTIGEVVTTNGQKSYTIDYDHDFKSDKPNFGAKSIRLQPKDIKLIRDAKVKESKGDGEQLEVINKAHADNGTAKKVFFTGTYEECKEFMRTHKSLKMDLMYKESGRLASYKL
jgi:hypothetical protein